MKLHLAHVLVSADSIITPDSAAGTGLLVTELASLSTVFLAEVVSTVIVRHAVDSLVGAAGVVSGAGRVNIIVFSGSVVGGSIGGGVVSNSGGLE